MMRTHSEGVEGVKVFFLEEAVVASGHIPILQYTQYYTFIVVNIVARARREVVRTRGGGSGLIFFSFPPTRLQPRSSEHSVRESELIYNLHSNLI